MRVPVSPDDPRLLSTPNRTPRIPIKNEILTIDEMLARYPRVEVESVITYFDYVECASILDC